MYTKSIPFKDFNGKPRNQTVHFNLTEHEVFKLMKQFQAIFAWQESLQGEPRDLDTDEVIEFYKHFEDVLLEAWGEPSDDGLHFRKGGRYDFEESALFAACMLEFVTNPGETTKLIDGLMPKGLQDVVRKAQENVDAMAADPRTSEQLQAEITRLRAQLGPTDTAAPIASGE